MHCKQAFKDLVPNKYEILTRTYSLITLLYCLQIPPILGLRRTILEFSAPSLLALFSVTDCFDIAFGESSEILPRSTKLDDSRRGSRQNKPAPLQDTDEMKQILIFLQGRERKYSSITFSITYIQYQKLVLSSYIQ